MAFTEFYCQSGGSNLNAGSTTNNTAAYTSTNGNWNGTSTFTPSDTQSASLVNVGDWASVYVDGASVGVYIARVTTVNQSGGNITSLVLSTTAKAGAAPSSSGTARTVKVGGAWLGPNAASGFPFTLTTFGTNQDASSNKARVNLKNDQTYSLTASYTPTTNGSAYVIQGYTSSTDDGGKANIDGGSSTAALLANSGPSNTTFIDLIFSTSNTSGTSALVVASVLSTFIRCVFHGARGNGLTTATSCTVIECEAYDCNKSNTAALAGFSINGATAMWCVSHDNSGNATSGFVVPAGPSVLQNCICDTNGQYGINITGTSANGCVQIGNCDVYNNTSDGIHVASGTSNPLWIANNNLIKNGGAGINNLTTSTIGYVYNCGYGSGTQANTNADTLGGLTQSGTVTYASNVTPWVDPANGDFRINLATANFAGRGSFTETAASYAGTVGYPDIGAAQSKTGSGGTFSKESSYGFGQ